MDQLMKILGEAGLTLENEIEMYHLVTVSWDQYGLKKGGVEQGQTKLVIYFWS